MPTVPLTVESPYPFEYTAGQTYYNERLAYEILFHARMLAIAGYEISFEISSVPDAVWSSQQDVLISLHTLLFAPDLFYNHQSIYNYMLDLSQHISDLLTVENSRENYALRAQAIASAMSAFPLMTEISPSFGEGIETQLQSINTTLSEMIPEEEPEEPEEPEEFSQDLWDAQSAMISAQSDYASSINGAIIEKRSKLPEESQLHQTLNETITQAQEKVGQYTLSKALTWLATGGPIGGIVVGVLGTVGLYAIKSLYYRYKYGEQLCGAIQSENNAMLGLTVSSEAYQMRAAAYDRHERALQYLLEELRHLESLAAQGTSDEILSKIENTLSGRTEPGEDTELDTFWEDVGEKLEQIMPIPDDNGNVPAIPEQPVRLPELPADNEARRNSLMAKMYYNLMRLEAAKIQELQKINENLDGLQYQSIEVEMGDRRVSVHGKIVDVADTL